MKESIYSILKGRFLTSETSIKNWKIIIFVVSLLLIMIWSSHSADEKVVKIAKLNSLKREIRAEYIDTNTDLTRVKMESSIRSRVSRLGLKPAENPPKKIVVKVK
ncbi:MAG: S-adenosyl-methyltransferase [Tenacibaculum sp.]|nr:S-adenosyl-methyltransferase [Tenacibaculum sp.]